MVEVTTYYLPPTRLIPNSPQPLIHYKNIIPEGQRRPDLIDERFASNDWNTQWIFRYGPTQVSHYHSAIHECMAVLTGTATVRFGVADTSPDVEKSTWGGEFESGGVEIVAHAGDAFVIPAGVSHKTHNTTPAAPFSLLTPGYGRGIVAEDKKAALAQIELSGFTMIGAYPKNCGNWDFSVGGEDEKNLSSVWNVSKPDKDPLLGGLSEGLVGLWKDIPLSGRGGILAKI